MIAFVTFQKEVVLAIINQSYTAKQFYPIPQILAIKLGMLILEYLCTCTCIINDGNSQ